jgi:hypothetical protein
VTQIMQATIENPGQSKRLANPMWRTRFFLLVVASIGPACTASGAEVSPPDDQMFFPTGMGVAPDGSVLFVANANAELRWDSGAIEVFDLNLVQSIVDGWTATKTIPDNCARDSDHTETLVCDETMFIKPHAGVRIGNFATDIAVQDTGGGTLRLIVPTRGDPSIAWADYANEQLTCSKSTTESNALCDDTHRLSSVENKPDLASLPDEPFAVYADSVGQFAMVTHLTTGAVTLVDSPRGGDAIVTDVLAGVFNPDPLTGIIGATGIVGRPGSGTNGSTVYVGSRSEDRVQLFSVGRPVSDAPPYLLTGGYFFLDGVGNNANGSVDTRGMAFSPSGNPLYLVNRNPPTLQVIDTSTDDAGFPRNQTIAATDICREGSNLAVMDAGAGERAYITCFQDGQLYVVDPRGTAQVEDVIEVGRGPFAVVAAPSRSLVFVTNFLEDTIAVIDAAPGSATHDRVVLRIGTVRPL